MVTQIDYSDVRGVRRYRRLPRQSDHFPAFCDSGDIWLTLSLQGDNDFKHFYRLHRSVLIANSNHFAAELRGRNSTGSLVSIGVDRQRSQCLVTWSKLGFAEKGQRVTQDVAGPKSQHLCTASHADAVSGQATRTDNVLLQAFENLFRIFYGLKPHLQRDNIVGCYLQCKALLHLGKQYGSLDVLGHCIERHLLVYGKILFLQIAKYPTSYLKLALLAESRMLFTEAFNHIVGQWPGPRAQLVGRVTPETLTLIEAKYNALQSQRLCANRRLLRLTSSPLAGHGSKHNPLLAWLADSLFHGWLVKEMASGAADIVKEDHEKHDHGAIGCEHSMQNDKIYFLLASSDASAVLDHVKMRQALNDASIGIHTKDSLRQVQRNVEKLKHQARTCVQEITQNRLHVSLEDIKYSRACISPRSTRSVAPGPSASTRVVNHLVCTKLRTHELPWAA